MLNINKWSKSLSSIVTVNTNSMLFQRKLLSPDENFYDDDNDSLTDVSVIIQKKSSFINDDQISKSIIQTDNSKHDQLFQSLLAYANSFDLDETVYSINDLKNQFDSIKKPSSKQRTQSIQNHKLIPTNFFSSKTSEDYNSDENTTITDGSKFQWEYLSDRIDSKEYKTKINFKNLENSSSPIIICEKTKDRFLPQTIDIQVLRSPTPIIIREILPKPSLSNRLISKNHLPSSSIIPSQCYQSSKPPIIPKRKINDQQISSIEHPKKIIIEYDQINITVDKNIKQRKEIKRVNPNEYVQKYGSSLYSNEIFHNLFTNIIS